MNICGHAWLDSGHTISSPSTPQQRSDLSPAGHSIPQHCCWFAGVLWVENLACCCKCHGSPQPGGDCPRNQRGSDFHHGIHFCRLHGRVRHVPCRCEGQTGCGHIDGESGCFQERGLHICFCMRALQSGWEARAREAGFCYSLHARVQHALHRCEALAVV